MIDTALYAWLDKDSSSSGMYFIQFSYFWINLAVLNDYPMYYCSLLQLFAALCYDHCHMDFMCNRTGDMGIRWWLSVTKNSNFPKENGLRRYTVHIMVHGQRIFLVVVHVSITYRGYQYVIFTNINGYVPINDLNDVDQRPSKYF